MLYYIHFKFDLVNNVTMLLLKYNLHSIDKQVIVGQGEFP